MQNDVKNVTKKIALCCKRLGKIHFAGNTSEMPVLAFHVNFPRLEIILQGSVADTCLREKMAMLDLYDVLYIPAKGWNHPVWTTPATILNILFGKRQLGFSIQHWNGNQLSTLCKINVSRRGPRVGAFLLHALNEMKQKTGEQMTARYIIAGLLSHCSDLLTNPLITATRSRTLFDVIREYIDDNFTQPLTRESVAGKFHISPNYLSNLFQRTGKTGFNEYLNHVRMEHAKDLLCSYNLKIKEVAHASGFADSNYFCRIFRNNTDRSPSEYRRQYYSQPILQSTNTTLSK